MKTSRQKIKNFLSMIITVLCIGFVIITLINMNINMDQLLNALSLHLFLIAILFFVIERHFNSFVWNSVLQRLGNKTISKRDTTEVYLKSNIGKYFPGNVMHYAGRNLIGRKYKLHQGDMALATMLEIGTMLLAAMGLLVAVGFRGNIDLIKSLVADKLIVYISVVAIFIVAMLIVAIKFKQQIRTYLHKRFNWKFIFLLMSIIISRMLMMFLAGVTFASIVQSMVDDVNWILIVKVYCFAWVLGFVVPGAPGGLGVRETVLIVLLTNIPQESLMIAMIWHRVATILSDIICFGLSFAWKRKDI